jgi:hypothetical protein
MASQPELELDDMADSIGERMPGVLLRSAHGSPLPPRIASNPAAFLVGRPYSKLVFPAAARSVRRIMSLSGLGPAALLWVGSSKDA